MERTLDMVTDQTIGVPARMAQDYICRFSKWCNSLPDIVDTDVISAFLSGTTYESLITSLAA